MTYQKLLYEADKKIAEKNLEKNVARLLLIYYASLDKPFNLYANLEEIVPKDIQRKFQKGLNKYVKKEIPFQHLTKTQQFFGYEFYVDKNVLIPRRETEELVEHLIYYLEDNYHRPIAVLDIGTGSGAIAITLAKELKNVNVTATDISRKALKVAIKNSQKHGAEIIFKKGDLFKAVGNEKYDVIVSNPPYIEEEGFIGPTVKHEPKVSLYGGEDGLLFYRKILSEARNHLNDNGLIAFEHAFDKAEEIKKIALNYFPNAKIILHKDLSGYDRSTLIEVGEIDV